MQIIEYRYRIPKEKREEFLKFAESTLKPTWQKYCCMKYELSTVSSEQIVGRQIFEEGSIVERLYFEDNFDLNQFYKETLENESDKTKSYEEKFGATDIELRILRTKVL